jgi:hypothetical protein
VVRGWCDEAGLSEVEVVFGYNGIEIHAGHVCSFPFRRLQTCFKSDRIAIKKARTCAQTGSNQSLGQLRKDLLKGHIGLFSD